MGKERAPCASSLAAQDSHTEDEDSDSFLDGYCSTVQGLLDWFEDEDSDRRRQDSERIATLSSCLVLI